MVPEIGSTTDIIFCHSGAFFALLYPYGHKKSRFWKIEKNTWRYYHFTNINDSDMIYGSSEIWSATNCLLFWTVFCSFTPVTTQKIKILKNKQIAQRYYYFTQVQHKWQSYDVWFLRYQAWQTEFFVILDHFLLFYPPNNLKKKKNEKNT